MNKHSFTLIELMISISISMLAFSAIVFSVMSAYELDKKIAGRIGPYNNALSALQMICTDIMAAKEIAPSSSSSKLVLSIDADIVSYDLNDLKIRRIKNGYSQYLTADKTVRSFCVSYNADGLTSVSVTPVNNNTPLTGEARCRNRP